MKGYKVFNPDWTCRGFQYEIGKTYKIDDKPIPCQKGFHFCERVADCFSYYAFDPQNKVAEVEAIGKVVKNGNKSCTNELKIVREVPWEEMLTLANSGHENTGYGNSGDCNSGNRNSGSRNSGHANSGYQNSGDSNSGNRNSGYHNSGDSNSGHRNSGADNSGNWNSGNGNSGNGNSGYYNSGDSNSGDWNKTNYSSGCFCTKEPKILFFDKKTDWTYETWRQSDARFVLNTMPKHKHIFTWFFEMTDDEKKAHPEAETTGGYGKEVIATDADRQKWWDELAESDKAKILALPNFDAEKFRMITGIAVSTDSATIAPEHTTTTQSPSNSEDEDELPFI